MARAHALLERRRATQKRNHPAKGSSIKVEPIRDVRSIAAIKALLTDQPRNLCLFTLGVNTAYRASELLSLRIGDVIHLRVGDCLRVKQLKNEKYRLATLNRTGHRALQYWLRVHPIKDDLHAPLFYSQRGCNALGVPAVSRLVKEWCYEVGLPGNYASHSLRKTWGFHQGVCANASVARLMLAFGHASEKQTLDYLCIQPKDIHDLYLAVEL